MQEPLLHRNIPDPAITTKSQQLRTALRTWTYLYSFYLSAFLYISAICVLSISHRRFKTGVFDFSTEDVRMIAIQSMMVIGVFLPIWLIFAIFMFIAYFILRKRRNINDILIQGSDVIHCPSYIYGPTAFVLSIGMIMVDLFYVHHWYGISLITGAFFLFLCVLYGPMLWHKIWPVSQNRYVGTSPTELTSYLP